MKAAKKVLAIYSCGNAALGASAVARAGGYELHAFVPDDVDPVVAAMLAERGTVVEKIPRSATGAGDPCYLAFRKALNQNGWLPFACAGNDNWSNIEGGATLGWEMVMQLLDRSQKIDSVVIQVGGGALARSVAQALEEALQLGFIQVLPRIHVCQPAGGFPFVRAYLLALAEIARRSGLSFDLSYDHGADPGVQLQRNAGLYARPPRSDSGGCRFRSAQLRFACGAVVSERYGRRSRPFHVALGWGDPAQPGPRDTG